jgi:sugar phosphate isomerase/epimerase
MKLIRSLPALLAILVCAAASAGVDDHLGLQMWSLRENTKAHGFVSSLDHVKDWSIPEIEGGLVTPGMNSAEVLAAIAERGLKMPSAHISYEALTGELDASVATAKELGLDFVICPWIPHDGEFTRATMEKAVVDFNRAGAAFRAAGIKFGYHPHGYEFHPTATPGETLLDDLIRACNPDDVCFEMDVFWVVHGGGDPVALLNKYAGRWMGLHIKDIRKGAPTGLTSGSAPESDNVAVGTGAIDWPAVLSTAEKVGAKYFIIEDETSEPLTNIPLSLEYLRTLKF